MSTNEKKYHSATKLIHGRNRSPHWDYSHHVIPPLTRSSSFKLGSVSRGALGFSGFGGKNKEESIYVYDRLGDPNTDLLQEALALAEGAETAVCFSSGMSAIQAAIMFKLSQGDEILSHRTIYGCTFSLLSRWLVRFGVTVRFVDMRDIDAVRSAINEKTRLAYLESPSNPTLELLDLPKLSACFAEINRARAPERQLLSVIDNTFATPFAQRPIEHGLSIVVHSLTKGISGFGVSIGGAVVTSREYEEDLLFFRKDFGGKLSPESAWQILVYGVSTLPIRMRQQQQNATRLAEYLAAHPFVERVVYPGLESFPQKELAHRMLIDYEGKFAPGHMVYCILKGVTPEKSLERGRLLMDLLAQDSYPVTLAVSLGQVRTLIEHPASMTHSAYPADEQIKRGIDPGGIRISVGLEEVEDIITDFERCLRYLPPL